MIENMSANAIRKPIPPFILFVLLTFAGLLGFGKLGINQFPDVDIPVVTVRVGQAGAAPAELESQVTRIVENAVATVGDVSHIMSTVSDGSSSTAIEFQFGKDIDRAVNDVRDAVTRVRGELPGDIDEPVITRMTTSGGPMMTFTVKSRDGAKSPAELSWFVDNEVAKKLLTVPGVGQVRRIGGVDREVRVVLRPDRLSAYGVTAVEVSRQLANVNVNVPGGKAQLGGKEQSIRTLGGAAGVEQLQQMQIALPDGRSLRLADLGDVVDGAADATQDAFVDDERVVAFQIVRGIGSSSRDTSALLPKLHLDERSLAVRTQLANASRESVDTLKLLRVPAAHGGSVTLDTVAQVEMGSGSAQITRFDRRRSVSIKADVGGAALGEVNQAIDALPSIQKLPADVKRADYGETERMNQLFADFGIAMIAGVLLVYCVLVLLFHDFAQPATIMAALPLSVGGALGLLLISGEAMSLPATIGILMLMGIVTKNSILLVEYALVALQKGASRRDAMLDACHKRARPILMTTVAMGAGMLPIALKIGADADFRAPMAIAVIGGPITSTVLSLFYVPVVFSYVDDLKRWVVRKVQRTPQEKASEVAA